MFRVLLPSSRSLFDTISVHRHHVTTLTFIFQHYCPSLSVSLKWMSIAKNNKPQYWVREVTMRSQDSFVFHILLLMSTSHKSHVWPILEFRIYSPQIIYAKDYKGKLSLSQPLSICGLMPVRSAGHKIAINNIWESGQHIFSNCIYSGNQNTTIYTSKKKKVLSQLFLYLALTVGYISLHFQKFILPLIVIIQWYFCLTTASAPHRNLIWSTPSLSGVTWRNRTNWDRTIQKNCVYKMFQETSRYIYIYLAVYGIYCTICEH